MDQVLERLRDAVVQGEEELTKSTVGEALQSGIDPLQIIALAVIPGVQRAGELWNEGEYFIPDIVMSAEAYKAAMTLLEPRLNREKMGPRSKMVIGVVAGDMHDLGKNLVVSMLHTGPFEVIDLGVNIPPEGFLNAVRQHQPSLLGIGAYMSTTMLTIRDIIAALKEQKLRTGLKVIVGGVPVTQKFADEVEADAYGKDAIDTLQKAENLLKE